jgi:hypothetical protein
LDVVVDWTFATSRVGVYVVQGSCGLDAFNARSCNFLIQSEPGGAVGSPPTAPKPRKVSASNVAAGSYQLLIANFAGVQESLSTQVFLSSATCPAFATAATRSGSGETDSIHSMTNGLR